MTTKHSQASRRAHALVGAFVAVAAAIGGAHHVDAVDQTSSQASYGYSNDACTAYTTAGKLNFCRVGRHYLKYTENRDSNLRSNSGGVSQDKYNDDVIVGTLAGVAANTAHVSNNFSNAAAYVCFYTGADYTGVSFQTGKTGTRVYNPGTSGLMSFKSC